MNCARNLTVALAIVLSSAAVAQIGEPIRVRGDKFYAGNDEFRIWGFSLCHGMSLTDRQLEQSMDRMKFLGTNMVRLHTLFQTMWSDWAGNPCGILPPCKASNTSRKFVNLDAFWKFLNALRDRGIYYSINLVHRRMYLPDDADILTTTDADREAWRRATAEMLAPKRPLTMRHLCRFDERAEAIEVETITNFMNLVNPKTGQRIADDPFFAMIETVNEATGPRWIRESKIAEQLPAYFRDKLVGRWCDYLAEKYGSEDKLKEAWAQPGLTVLAEGESLAARTIGLHPVLDEFDKYSAARSKDLLEFLVSLDIAFYQRMREVYLQAGFKGPTHYGDISLCPGGNADYLWTASRLGDFWSDHGYPSARTTPLGWPTLDCVKTCIREGVTPHPYAWDRPYWKAEWRTRNAERILDPLFCAVYFSLTGIDGYTPHSWEMRYDADWYGATGLLANQVTVFDLNGDLPWQMVYRAAGRLFHSSEIKPLTDVETLRRFLTNANVTNHQVDRQHAKRQLVVNTEHFSAVAADHPGRYEFDDLAIDIASEGPVVVIVERTDGEGVEYDYEITAVGQAGEFISGEPIKWDPVEYVRGQVTFKNGAEVEAVTWLREDGTTMRQLPASGPAVAFRSASPQAPKGVRLYRVKLKYLSSTLGHPITGKGRTAAAGRRPSGAGSGGVAGRWAGGMSSHTWSGSVGRHVGG